MIVIRESTLDDIPELQDIEVDAGELFRLVGLDTIADDDPPGASTLAQHINVGTAWTAELDSVVTGYALASEVDGMGHLDQVSVRRAGAGRGIGRLLIDQVCLWATGRGYDALTLTTFVDVPWNGPYYERLGFQRVPASGYGPQLERIRRLEGAAGLDVAPRAVMRLPLPR
ncbi:MAG: GNAT family N-acetyltransferase [Actinomycetota bacterium]